MYRAVQCIVIASLVTGAIASNLRADEPQPNSTDWPWWRGPERNGIAAANQHPPLEWSRTENVLWKTHVAGRGHGSVTVVGDQVFLATADEQADQQLVLCFGERLRGNVVEHDEVVVEQREQLVRQERRRACRDGDLRRLKHAVQWI